MPNASQIMVTPTSGLTSRSWGDRMIDVVNVLDFVQVADTGIAAAINRAAVFANGRGGGCVVIPFLGATLLLEAKVTILDNVYFEFLGRPVLQLKNGTNDTMFEGLNYSTLTGGSTNGGPSNFGLRNVILDGNSSNNGSPAAGKGHGVAFYGRNFILEDVEIRNTFREGLHTEFGGTTSPFNGRLSRILIQNAGEHGWRNRVSDLHVEDVNVYNASLNTDNTFDAIWLESGGNIRGALVQAWAIATGNHYRYGLNIEADAVTLDGGHFETGKTASIRVSSNSNSLSDVHGYNALATVSIILAGSYNKFDGFSQVRSGGGGETGIQIGEGGKALSNSVIRLRSVGQTSNAIVINNDGGWNVIDCVADASATSPLSGTPNTTDVLNLYDPTTLEVIRKTRSRQVAAAGSTTTDATVLASASCTLTSTGAGQGVRLPAAWAVAGFEGELINGSTNAILVYPHTGGNWQGLGSNASVSLAAGAMMFFKRATTGGWAMN